MFQSLSSPRPGGGLTPVQNRSHRSRSRPRPEDTRPGQERAPRRGARLHRNASPSSARRASPSPSRRPSKPHRQHSREHHVHSRPAILDYRFHLKSKRNQQPEHVSPRRSEDSVSSSVSSSGSLLGTAGYASSRTSLEDEAEPQKRGRRSPELRTIRERRLDRHGDHRKTSSPPEDGSSLWSRVATAASTLTVSVGKAWAVNVPMNAGEDTQPGEESRLFRAMKAYHLDKARDPSDLPPWLFTEHERRPVGQLRLNNRQDNTDGSPQPSPLSPRGLRDVYNAAATVTSPTSPRSYTDGPTSKAATHLKALRDAKRNVLTPNVTSPREEVPVEVEELQHRKRAQRRMGMPMGAGAIMQHGRF